MIKTKGIVFRSFKYRETSLILDIFTQELGLRSYLVNGVRSSKSKNSASALQAMMFLDLVVYDKNGPEKLNRIKEFKLSTYYQKIPFDVIRSMIGQFMIEVLRKCLKDHEANNEIYLFMEDWFNFLDTTNNSLANLLVLFMIELAAHIGFAFAFEKVNTHIIFDLQEGQFTSEIPDHKYFITGERSNLLFLLIQNEKQDVHEISMANNVRSLLLDELILFYRLHIESFGEIKSLEILRSVLS